jgi:hypothetical protein
MTITAPCAKCGRPMELEFHPDATKEIAERMAKLVACDQCNPNFWRPNTKPAPAKPTTTKATEQNLPYADD